MNDNEICQQSLHYDIFEWFQGIWSNKTKTKDLTIQQKQAFWTYFK